MSPIEMAAPRMRDGDGLLRMLQDSLLPKVLPLAADVDTIMLL